jgi:hypothetical protein
MPSLLSDNPDKSHPTMSSKNKDDRGAQSLRVAATIVTHSSPDTPASPGGGGVVIVETWHDPLRRCALLKAANDIFKSRKYGSPSVTKIK